jgi:hypothetical protein
MDSDLDLVRWFCQIVTIARFWGIGFDKLVKLVNISE